MYSMREDKLVRIEWIGNIKKIVFNRPDKLNAFNTELMEEVISEVSKLGRAKALVFTGEGRFFSAGIDLAEVASCRDSNEVQNIFRTLARMFNTIASVDIPVIILLNGDAYGGGAEFIWLGDFVVAPKGIRIGWAESRWGLVPPIFPYLGSLTLGIIRSKYIAYTSGYITSEDAYHFGLISQLVDNKDELEKALEEILKKLSGISPYAFKSMKNYFRMVMNHQLTMYGVSELIRLSGDPQVKRKALDFIERKELPSYNWGF